MALTVSINDLTPALTRHFIQYSGTAPTDAQLATFDAAVVSAYTSHVVPVVSEFDYLTQVETVDLSSATSAVDTTAASVAGSLTGTTLPAEVAGVQSYEIARRYRGGHPRGYWRVGDVTKIGGGRQWASSFVTSAESALNAYFTALLAAGWTGAGTLTHVNVSYYAGFTVVTSPTTGRARNVPKLRSSPVVDLVNSTTFRSSYGTQRRRVEFVD